tara:strand:- start:261 stop:854 length:594 start_codon:yes stop_codon:yes gene_type:complete
VSKAIEVSKIDVSAVSDALNAYQKKLRGGSKIGVVNMAQAIARAASAATRPGAKVRAIVFTKKGTTRKKNIMYIKKIIGPKKQDVVLIGVRAYSKAEARADKRAQIMRQGLAKASWFFILSALGGKMGKPRTGRKVKKSARVFSINRQIVAKHPAILMHNKLDYATDAFRVKGRATMDNIGKRAANTLVRWMEKISD